MSLVEFKPFCWGKSFDTVEATRLGSINKGSLEKRSWPIVMEPKLQLSH